MIMIKFKPKIVFILIISFILINSFVYSCAHDHHHGHEKPSFKYSREANEPKPSHSNHHEHIHSHSHSHEDSHHNHHGHSHENNHHGHSHEDSHHNHHGHSHENDHHGHSHENNQNTKRSSQSVNSRDKFEIALHACLSTVLISLAPFVLLFFIPLKNNNIENQSLLNVLLAFASGSLLGDAFLHLIPHALHPHDHHEEHHSHSHEEHDHSAQTTVGLWVLAGILAFLFVEKVVRNIKGDGHGHSHSHSHKKDSDDEKKEKKDNKEKKEKKKKSKEVVEDIKIAGYLNLVADFAHNFTDGLAIGASYLAGHNIGLVTTLTILFHEVPHEIGDFAILIQSGCSKKKAIYLQLVTALGALSGTVLSLFFESAMSGIATSCILPFTAGGFIYIATVSIMPDLRESSNLKQSFKEIVALISGILMMVVIAFME